MTTNNTQLELEVRNLIAKIIDVDSEKITPNANFIEELGSDSMMALEIMAALEKKYGVTIPEDELVKMANLSQVVNLMSVLLKKGENVK